MVSTIKALVFTLTIIALYGCQTAQPVRQSVSASESSPNIVELFGVDMRILFELAGNELTVSGRVVPGLDQKKYTALLQRARNENIDLACIHLQADKPTLCDGYSFEMLERRKAKDAFNLFSGAIVLPLTLALDVLEPHKSGSNTVNTFTALEADERLIALYADAVNSIIFKEYENAVKSNSADSLKVFMDKYSIDADNAFFKAALLASYRAENTFAGFMGAFRLQGEAEDIRQAMQRATTPTQLAEAEHALVRMIPFDRLFSLRLGERYDSPLRAANQSALFHSVTAQVKDIERKVRISVRGDSPLQLQQAVLRVKVDFVEHFDYSPPLNGPEKDVLKQSLTFHLRPGNNWSDEQTLVFKGVPVQGTYRPGGVGGINLLSRLIGGPSVSADAFDMEFSLLGSRLEYEVGEWQ